MGVFAQRSENTISKLSKLSKPSLRLGLRKTRQQKATKYLKRALKTKSPTEEAGQPHHTINITTTQLNNTLYDIY
jgi:hypothetical protein